MALEMREYGVSMCWYFLICRHHGAPITAAADK